MLAFSEEQGKLGALLRAGTIYHTSRKHSAVFMLYRFHGGGKLLLTHSLPQGIGVAQLRGFMYSISAAWLGGAVLAEFLSDGLFFLSDLQKSFIYGKMKQMDQGFSDNVVAGSQEKFVIHCPLIPFGFGCFNSLRCYHALFLSDIRAHHIS